MLNKIILLILISICLSVNAEQKNSIFWHMKDLNGQAHYIFGTIHVDDSRVTNFHHNVYEALSTSTLFLNETDAIDDFSILFHPEAIIEKNFTSEELEKIKELSYFHTMPYENTIKMKPWLLAFIFNSPRPITPFNQDNLLKSKAIDKGLKTLGIETVNEHFETLDFFSDNEQLSILRAVLAKTENNKIEDYENLIKNYVEMNVDKILLIDQQNTKNLVSAQLWLKMKKKLLVDRNKLFADRIKSKLKNNHLFIAVGASHLGGENGLISQFKLMGFELTPLSAFN